MSPTKLLIIAFVLVIGVLTSCGQAAPTATRPPSTATAPSAVATSAPPATPTPAATATPAPTPTSAPVRGGTLKWLSFASASRVDPHLYSAMIGNGDIWGVLGNSLFRLDWITGAVNPGVASGFELKSPTEVIVRIKPGVKFQAESLAKGREVDSQDVVASLNRVRTKTAPFVWGITFQRIANVEAVDNLTVRITLSSPDANLLPYLSNPLAGVILPKEATNKYATVAMGEDGWYGTGAFAVDYAAYRPDVSGAANKNATYGVDPGQPYLDRVEWVRIDDASTRLAALRTRQLDLELIPLEERARFEADGWRIHTISDGLITGQHIGMNTQVAPTSDVRVRRAINMVIDREELKQIVGSGFACTVIILGCKANLFLPEKDWAGKPGFKANKQDDISAAKALLKEAGIDPTTTTLVLASQPQGPYKVHLEQAVAVASQLQRSLGFKIDHQANAQYAQTAKAATDLKYQLSNVALGQTAGMIMDAPLWQHFHSVSVQNTSLWKDPQTDQLIEAETGTLDPALRQKLLQQLQVFLMDDARLPVAPTVRNFDLFAINPKLKNWKGTVHFPSKFAWQFAGVWLEK